MSSIATPPGLESGSSMTSILPILKRIQSINLAGGPGSRREVDRILVELIARIEAGKEGE